MTKHKFIIFCFLIFVTAIFTTILISKRASLEILHPTPTPKSEVFSFTDQQFQQSDQPTSNNNRELALVTKVIDGDTVELEGGLRVRYIGVDTPETVHPQKAIECFGREAAIKNKELVEGKIVELEKDVSQTDKYGRLLRYVYRPTTEAPGDQIFVNDYLVREGYALASSFPPDIKYQNMIVEAQKEAQENNRGLWSTCEGQNQTQQAASSQCPIKGNISSAGEKIYHMPEQDFYEKTVIDENKGEKWFCTEAEATEAGWRKSKR